MVKAPKPAAVTTDVVKPKEPEVPLPKKHSLAFTVERVPGGWSFVTITYDGDASHGQILKVERTEPDVKSITLEKFKIASFKHWSTIG